MKKYFIITGVLVVLVFVGFKFSNSENNPPKPVFIARIDENNMSIGGSSMNFVVQIKSVKSYKNVTVKVNHTTELPVPGARASSETYTINNLNLNKGLNELGSIPLGHITSVTMNDVVMQYIQTY